MKAAAFWSSPASGSAGVGGAVTLKQKALQEANLDVIVVSAFGSVVAFGCYLLLQQRIGVGPASTVGVATTVIALLVSVAVEGYRPGLLAGAGVALAIAGNALALGWKLNFAFPFRKPPP
jgi:drug/metabolite transporter (DMT)-like permease